MTKRWSHDRERLPSRWECAETDECGVKCGAWGGFGGERTNSNVRRAKGAAREHTDESGHSTTVLVVDTVYVT